MLRVITEKESRRVFGDAPTARALRGAQGKPLQAPVCEHEGCQEWGTVEVGCPGCGTKAACGAHAHILYAASEKHHEATHCYW